MESCSGSDTMINNKEMLQSMHRTTRTAQTGLRAVLKTSMEPELKSALVSQLREYDSIGEEVKALEMRRGIQVPRSHSALQNMIERMTRLKLGKKERSYRIANMIIQGNTQGMIVSLRDRHQYAGKDLEVKELNKKLIYTEIENIRQMKPFL